MRTSRVLQNWDVIVVLDRDKANEILELQYANKQNNKIPRKMSGTGKILGVMECMFLPSSYYKMAISTIIYL